MIISRNKEMHKGIDEDSVRVEMVRFVNDICLTLPDGNDPVANPAGIEFAKLMFDVGLSDGEQVHKKAVEKAIEKATGDRDDLSDCPHLRELLVEEIKRRK